VACSLDARWENARSPLTESILAILTEWQRRDDIVDVECLTLLIELRTD
jgi:hypothetical protein